MKFTLLEIPALVLQVWENLHDFFLSFQHYILRVTLKCFSKGSRLPGTGYCGECPLVLGSSSTYPEAPYSSMSQDNLPHLLNVIN